VKQSVITALLMILGAFVMGGWATYELAGMGEPQSAWFWCDVIGLCPGGRQ